MFVYKITNKINNKIYIGCTILPIHIRLRKHSYGKKKSKCNLAKAICKYGIDNFSIEELELCNSREEMFIREMYWIFKLDSQNPKIGYNMTPGGCIVLPKIGNESYSSYYKKGKTLEQLYGIDKANKLKEGLSITHKGKTFSPELIIKMNESRKRAWERGCYKNMPQKLSIKFKGVKKDNNIPILCLNNNKIYRTCKDAADDLDLWYSGVYRVISGKMKQTGGYKFVVANKNELTLS